MSLLRRFAILFCFLVLPPPASAGAYDDILAAANRDDTAGVIDLLQRGMDINTADPSGNTLLMIAARNCNGNLLDYLLRNKCNLLKRNRYVDAAIMLATFRGHTEISRRLLDAGADIQQSGWNALHYAAYAGHVEVVRLLIERKADLDAKAPNGQTALMLAVGTDHLDVVKFLVDADADMDVEDAEGRTALSVALKAGYSEIADYLRKSGADE